MAERSLPRPHYTKI